MPNRSESKDPPGTPQPDQARLAQPWRVERLPVCTDVDWFTRNVAVGEKQIRHLRSRCQKESWVGGLENYLSQSFLRAAETDCLLGFGTPVEALLFNTGLLDQESVDVYLLLFITRTGWRLSQSLGPNQLQSARHMTKLNLPTSDVLPRRPTYHNGTDYSKMYFNPYTRFKSLDFTSLLRQKRDGTYDCGEFLGRLPENYCQEYWNRQDNVITNFGPRVMTAIRVALRRAEANPRMAVPHFFRSKGQRGEGQIQLLLPMNIGQPTSLTPDCALCVQLVRRAPPPPPPPAGSIPEDSVLPAAEGLSPSISRNQSLSPRNVPLGRVGSLSSRDASGSSISPRSVGGQAGVSPALVGLSPAAASLPPPSAGLSPPVAGISPSNSSRGPPSSLPSPRVGTNTGTSSPKPEGVIGLTVSITDSANGGQTISVTGTPSHAAQITPGTPGSSGAPGSWLTTEGLQENNRGRSGRSSSKSSVASSRGSRGRRSGSRSISVSPSGLRYSDQEELDAGGITEYYELASIVRLEWAHRNARMVQPIDQAWLLDWAAQAPSTPGSRSGGPPSPRPPDPHHNQSHSQDGNNLLPPVAEVGPGKSPKTPQPPAHLEPPAVVNYGSLSPQPNPMEQDGSPEQHPLMGQQTVYGFVRQWQPGMGVDMNLQPVIQTAAGYQLLQNRGLVNSQNATPVRQIPMPHAVPLPLPAAAYGQYSNQMLLAANAHAAAAAAAQQQQEELNKPPSGVGSTTVSPARILPGGPTSPPMPAGMMNPLLARPLVGGHIALLSPQQLPAQGFPSPYSQSPAFDPSQPSPPPGVYVLRPDGTYGPSGFDVMSTLMPVRTPPLPDGTQLPPGVDQAQYITRRPCKFFRVGRCRRGDQCTFSHRSVPAEGYVCKICGQPGGYANTSHWFQDCPMRGVYDASINAAAAAAAGAQVDPNDPQGKLMPQQ